MALCSFSIKHLVNFIPSSCTVLIWKKLHLHDGLCKVKMLQRIKENVETFFSKQCMLHHNANYGKGKVGQATCVSKG